MTKQKKIIIASGISLFAALKQIESALKEFSPPLVIDLSVVSFPLTRDVFLVLKKRFRADQIELIVKHQYQVDIARSVGLAVSLSGVRADFDREFEKDNLAKHNFTAWEYFVYELKRGIGYMRFLLTRKKEKKLPLYRSSKSKTHMILIVSGLIMSLSLLLFIFHFAVSKTYIHVTPKITVRPISTNIVFSSGSGATAFESSSTVRMKNFPVTAEMTLPFAVSTIDPNSATNAKGRATLYNELTVEQVLKPSTRFVTEEGIIFRTADWVRIPGARSSGGMTEIGSVDVFLEADPYDSAGKLIGERGNVATDTYLSIPGLKFNRDKVYGSTKEAFVGGANPGIHILTEEEYARMKSVLHEQLQKSGRSLLEAKLTEQNSQNNENYTLLSAESVVFSGEVMEIVSGQKVGDLTNEVTLKGSVQVSALVYDKNAVIDRLKSVFHEKFLDGREKDLGMHPDTLRIVNIITTSDDGSNIKATVEMNSSITYDLENPSNELTRKMKVTVSGLSKSEAIKRLINTGQVREVDISFSPFWMRTVSSNLDNIEFIIK